MTQAPRRKSNATAVKILMGSTGKYVVVDGNSFNVTHGSDRELSGAAKSIFTLCSIT